MENKNKTFIVNLIYQQNNTFTEQSQINEFNRILSSYGYVEESLGYDWTESIINFNIDTLVSIYRESLSI